MTQRRRIPFILLAALAMAFALATSVLAAGELNIECEDRTVDLENDDTFEVAVKSSGTSTYATGMVDVEFDSDVFELTNIKFNTSIAPNNATYLAEDKVNEIVGGEGGTTAEQAYEFIQQAKSRTEGTPVVVTPGQFRVDFGDDLAPQNFTANNDDVLFTLTFKINKATTKEGPFTITLDTVDASYLDAEGNLISAVNLEDGTIKKGSGAVAVNITVSNLTKGTATVIIAEETITGEGIKVEVDSNEPLTISSSVACAVYTTTDDVNYTVLTAKATGEENKYIFDIVPVDGLKVIVSVKGDVSLNGKVDLADYLRILSDVKNKTKIAEPLNQKIADVSRNGKIDLADYLRVLSHVKKKQFLVW